MNWKQACAYITRSLVVAVVLNVSLHSQTDDKGAFKIIPEDQRQRFISRLDLYMDCLRRKDCKPDELYDAATLCSLCKGRPNCNEDFCKGDPDCLRACRPVFIGVVLGDSTTMELLDLKLGTVKPLTGARQKYRVTLDRKFRLTMNGETRIYKDSVNINATRQNEDWYFSMINPDDLTGPPGLSSKGAALGSVPDSQGGGAGTDRIVAADVVDRKPILLHRARPNYTEEARKNKIQGVVYLRVLVRVDGSIGRATITKGLPNGLNEEAIRAAYQMNFVPAMKDNKPVPFWIETEVEFTLPR